MNTETVRQPVNPAAVKQEIDDIFFFRAPMSHEHADSCRKIQEGCQSLAKLIADEVPEGKEQTIAINNLLSTALFARHGITRRQIVMGAMPVELPPPEPVATGSPEPLLEESKPLE